MQSRIPKILISLALAVPVSLGATLPCDGELQRCGGGCPVLQ